ncbi:hypothetical protein [Wolbachia endosymbiont of Aedes albopictus]|uniref:hypothetical protein n=1 Tax=Wolbachia endosymbiont of Aedes albopictus TaxID=167957 RepID=UPI00216A283B|nr:hypothetical protein [Wolbachia endosymbiont of Aedes albopictus]UVW84175.1 hypothetical protein NHG98_01490 [Wolbachia endosymbiont of Aedes albopictus]
MTHNCTNIVIWHIVNDVIPVPRLLGSRKKNDVMKAAPMMSFQSGIQLLIENIV